ncbi:sulfurtransferase TusA family protein [Acetobacter ascendens]|uniref:sulfurtransferase TusA family protein n=1 Tax=Acetobacter ascendens TaxID=481146 RepID=UPI000875D56B|nr:sulfurtransferase TusA family protein [Acetobacter ascendens]AOW49654.1 regulator [Acetobacter ascendens]
MNETVLDARGLNCPLPVLKANRVLRTMQPGERLRILVTDRASITDFQVFCRETGHALIAFTDENSVFCFTVKCRASAPANKPN